MKTKDLFKLKEQMILARRKDIIKNHKEYSFPVFMKLLRDNYDVSRHEMAFDTGIAASRLYHLERGNFKRKLSPAEIDILSDYFGLPWYVLQQKSELFLKYNQEVKCK